MLNERGEIASASMANLFWVKEGKLRTPARECGCRAGTVRRWVLERSGQKVEEGRWRKEELDGAEEIFLTNARIGIQPVVSWNGKKLARAGVAEALVKAFWAE
jgi:branched-subunit amino acid aminotransferase/4-amino-4-deoxychorismate lyase